MMIHCAEYWKDTQLMLDNFEKGIFPIDTGCTHPTPCPNCYNLEAKI